MQKPIKVSYHLAKFSSHKHSGIGETMIFVSHGILTWWRHHHLLATSAAHRSYKNNKKRKKKTYNSEALRILICYYRRMNNFHLTWYINIGVFFMNDCNYPTVLLLVSFTPFYFHLNRLISCSRCLATFWSLPTFRPVSNGWRCPESREIDSETTSSYRCGRTKLYFKR